MRNHKYFWFFVLVMVCLSAADAGLAYRRHISPVAFVVLFVCLIGAIVYAVIRIVNSGRRP